MCEFWSGRAGAFPAVLGAGEGLLSPEVYVREMHQVSGVGKWHPLVPPVPRLHPGAQSLQTRGRSCCPGSGRPLAGQLSLSLAISPSPISRLDSGVPQPPASVPSPSESESGSFLGFWPDPRATGDLLSQVHWLLIVWVTVGRFLSPLIAELMVTA